MYKGSLARLLDIRSMLKFNCISICQQQREDNLFKDTLYSSVKNIKYIGIIIKIYKKSIEKTINITENN